MPLYSMPYTKVLLFSSSVKFATISAFFCLEIAEAAYNKKYTELSHKKMSWDNKLSDVEKCRLQRCKVRWLLGSAWQLCAAYSIAASSHCKIIAASNP